MSNPVFEVFFKLDGATFCEWALGPGTYVIGGKESDLFLDEASISPRHALLTITARALYLEDLGSEAGTYVNGKRIKASTRLFPHQKVRLGNCVTLEIHRKPISQGSGTGKVETSGALKQILPVETRFENRYEIGDQIAQGGMGAILQARDAPIRRTVAMKVMLLDASERAYGRFIEEAQITGQLEHPNIVPVHELGIDEHEQPFYTMKFVRGVTLREVETKLREGDSDTIFNFPLDRLLTVFQKVCDAVAFAHSKRVIHRDLKPENVMIGNYGEVLVMDWGLAKVLSDEPPPLHSNPGWDQGNISLPSLSISETLIGAIIGTPQYMSPEQARGETETIDARSDIYSLGGILYNMLFLRPPVEGATQEALLDNVRAGRVGLKQPVQSGWSMLSPLPHLPTGRPPKSLVAVAMKAMSLERSERYQTVGDLQADIRAYQSGFATSAENASAYTLLRLALGRYKREVGIAVIALVALLAVGIFAFLKVTRERSRAESALAELRNTAPAFAAQASALAAEERFPEALEKLDYAIKLCPEDAIYLVMRGDLLECQQQFAAASRAYRQAEKLDAGQARARVNAEMCERLQAEHAQTGRVSHESLRALLNLMVSEQRSTIQRMPIARILGEEDRLALEYCRERLKDFPLSPDQPLSTRLVVRPDGGLSLNLSGTSISDLQPLAGMPLVELDLSGCSGVRNLQPLAKATLRKLNIDGTGVTDLGPLRGLALEELSLRHAAVSDLSPLAGMPLTSLDCAHIPATNFIPLTGAPLRELVLSGTKVGPLAFLRGMPVRALRLDGCTEARGYSVLPTLQALECLVLPKRFYELPAEDLAGIQGLHDHSALKQITATTAEGKRSSDVGSADEFWRDWETDLTWLRSMLAVGARPTFARLPDRSWEVSFRYQAVAEISFLKNTRISKLDLFGTLVTNLEPLVGMPLQSLDLRHTDVEDLSPIRDMPLRELYLWRTKVTDFRPLSSLTELRILDLSGLPFDDLSLLRSNHLRLLRIGSTKVRSFSPLAGLPLEVLHSDNVEVSDVRPLTQCPELRWIVLPKAAHNASVLRSLPKLERISELFGHESEPMETAPQYWERYERENKPPSP